MFWYVSVQHRGHLFAHGTDMVGSYERFRVCLDLQIFLVYYDAWIIINYANFSHFNKLLPTEIQNPI